MPTKMFYGGTFLINGDLRDTYIDCDMELEYYKVKSGEVDTLREESKIYGIEVVKKEYNNNEVLQESKEIFNITNDEMMIDNLLEVLKRNTVTPIGLENVLEDLTKKSLSDIKN